MESIKRGACFNREDLIKDGSMVEVDFIDSTYEEKQTFEISEIGYKVQFSMARITAQYRSMVGVHLIAETCMRDEIVRGCKIL